MVNKLFIISATLAFFLILTNASIYRTIAEFDEQLPADPIGPKEKQCMKDFRQSEHLTACQQWVNMQIQANPQDPQQLLQKCCQDLHKENPHCVCPTLEEVARAVKLQGQHGPAETTRIYLIAKHLPDVCNLPKVSVCPFQIIPPSQSYY